MRWCCSCHTTQKMFIGLLTWGWYDMGMIRTTRFWRSRGRLLGRLSCWLACRLIGWSTTWLTSRDFCLGIRIKNWWTTSRLLGRLSCWLSCGLTWRLTRRTHEWLACRLRCWITCRRPWTFPFRFSGCRITSTVNRRAWCGDLWGLVRGCSWPGNS